KRRADGGPAHACEPGRATVARARQVQPGRALAPRSFSAKKRAGQLVMWRPSRMQWLVIWLTVLVALALWVSGSPYGKEQDRAAASIVVLGALLVWQLAGRRDPRRVLVPRSPVPRLRRALSIGEAPEHSSSAPSG